MEQDSQCVKKIQKKNAFFGNNDERLITLFWISFPLIAEQMTSSYIPLFFVFFLTHCGKSSPKDHIIFL